MGLSYFSTKQNWCKFLVESREVLIDKVLSSLLSPATLTLTANGGHSEVPLLHYFQKRGLLCYNSTSVRKESGVLLVFLFKNKMMEVNNYIKLKKRGIERKRERIVFLLFNIQVV